MKSLTGFFLLLAFAFPALGRETAVTLMTPAEPVSAGQSARVDVVAMNPGAREASFDVEKVLEGTLKAGNASWPVSLHSGGPVPAAVSAGGFAVRRFTFDVPAAAVGRAILEVKRADGTPLRGVIDIVAAAPTAPQEAPAGPAATPLDGLASSAPAASGLASNFAGRFLPNQPIYFIYGDGAQAAKFQFSFDYRIATMVFGQAGHETVATLRGGYTQRSLCDLNSESSPFYDTSYMPEITLNTEARMPRAGGRLFTWLGLRAGFQHESNGRQGTDSRSLNIFYVRPRFVLGSLESWNVVMLPEVFTYVGDVADNKGIENYRGYGKLRLYLGRGDGPSLMFTGWAGKDFDHGTFQWDLAVPTRIRWLNIESFLYLQYFNGYGESLRAYDRKSDAVRAGVSLVR